MVLRKNNCGNEDFNTIPVPVNLFPSMLENSQQVTLLLITNVDMDYLGGI